MKYNQLYASDSKGAKPMGASMSGGFGMQTAFHMPQQAVQTS
jgi:hypothetical protein